MSKKDCIRVASRASKLALMQTGLIVDELKNKNPHLQFLIKKIKTEGDQRPDAPLEQIGGQGVFVKELEKALLAGEADFAVHSLKDVPTELDPGLRLAAIPKRNDSRDVLVSHSGKSLSELPEGSRIGTGSLRRSVQIKAFRCDLEICALRGNIDTRLRKVNSGEFDGIILAASAMLRMGWEDKITQFLPAEVCLPAPGQGALAIEIRKDDTEMASLIARINHELTEKSVSAERAFLCGLGGGCRAPIAALGIETNGLMELEGMVANPDGRRMLRDKIKGPLSTSEELGKNLAQKLLEMGAREIIAEHSG